MWNDVLCDCRSHDRSALNSPNISITLMMLFLEAHDITTHIYHDVTKNSNKLISTP